MPGHASCSVCRRSLYPQQPPRLHSLTQAGWLPPREDTHTCVVLGSHVFIRSCFHPSVVAIGRPLLVVSVVSILGGVVGFLSLWRVIVTPGSPVPLIGSIVTWPPSPAISASELSVIVQPTMKQTKKSHDRYHLAHLISPSPTQSVGR